jgi:hypothetical protein
MSVGEWAAMSGRAPGKPLNLSVTMGLTYARVSWTHGSSTEGGLATHYVAKWQSKDGEEAQWYPEWLGVGDETVSLQSLKPGSTYAIRVAAINKQGRAWSDMAIFTTLTDMRCDGSWHWNLLFEVEEVQKLCGKNFLDDPGDPDPRGGCSVAPAPLTSAREGVAHNPPHISAPPRSCRHLPHLPTLYGAAASGGLLGVHPRWRCRRQHARIRCARSSLSRPSTDILWYT